MRDVSQRDVSPAKREVVLRVLLAEAGLLMVVLEQTERILSLRRGPGDLELRTALTRLRGRIEDGVSGS